MVWDDPRTWVISVQLEKPVLSLLREHMFLFTDIVRDWTSGPPADYDHFVPYLYRIKLKMIDVTLNLYLNEYGVIAYGLSIFLIVALHPFEIDKISSQMPKIFQRIVSIR